MDFTEFLSKRWPDILEVSWWHLQLSLMSVGLAALIGLPLGVLSHANRHCAALILTVVSTIYTVPTLALFGLMIPLIGIGVLPAVVAVVLYSLLPIVQNTYSGLANVDPHLREVATGMGMGRPMRLARVELPLAMPVIFAGLRIAVVNAIGMVTLASLIAAGGLGDFVFRGISIMSWNVVLAGSLPVLAMAVAADLLLKAAEARVGRGQARGDETRARAGRSAA